MAATTKVNQRVKTFFLGNFFNCFIFTTKESEAILKSANIDEDAKTRNQSKTINNITTVPAKLKKHSTMTATTQVAKRLQLEENLSFQFDF